MSRQIISYADLGPVKATNTPALSFEAANRRSPPREEPPRKRLRTDRGDATTMSPETIIQAHSMPISALNSPTRMNGKHVNGHQTPGGRRKNQKQRPGNPSGVHWSEHWDSQNNVGPVKIEDALAYGENIEIDAILSTEGPVKEITAVSSKVASTSKPKPNPAFGSGMGKKATKRKQRAAEKAGHSVKAGETVPLSEEGWDDSALIDAWNAAEEQYREMNGGKKWRLEPVRHSSLWDSTLDNGQSANSEDESQESGDHEEGEYEAEELEDDLEATQEDSTPAFSALNGTWPTFDSLPKLPPGSASAAMEEAFNKVKEASYTLGYWTAVYQMHAQQQVDSTTAAEADEDDVPAEEQFAPTQR